MQFYICQHQPAPIGLCSSDKWNPFQRECEDSSKLERKKLTGFDSNLVFKIGTESYDYWWTCSWGKQKIYIFEWIQWTFWISTARDLPCWHIHVSERLWGKMRMISWMVRELLNRFIGYRNVIGRNRTTCGNKRISLRECDQSWLIGWWKWPRSTRFTTKPFSWPFRSSTDSFRTCRFCAGSCSWWERQPCSLLRKLWSTLRSALLNQGLTMVFVAGNTKRFTHPKWPSSCTSPTIRTRRNKCYAWSIWSWRFLLSNWLFQPRTTFCRASFSCLDPVRVCFI